MLTLSELQDFLETHLKIFTPKCPIAKHLKEGMMGKVSAHILQVVVASSGPHAFLAVGHTPETCHLASWIHGAQEDWLELERVKKGERGGQDPREDSNMGSEDRDG